MNSNCYLTKSLFQKACECPRKLKYALHPLQYARNNNSYNGDTFFSSEEQKLEAYSRLVLFPKGGGIWVGEGDHRDSKDSLSKLSKQTKSLLFRNTKLSKDRVVTAAESSDESVVLFEGTLQSGFFCIRADILHKIPSARELRLLEVKSKSWDTRLGSVPEQLFQTSKHSLRASFLPYLRDVAFQKMVLQKVALEEGSKLKITSWLVLPNKAQINTRVPHLNALLQPRDDCKTSQDRNDNHLPNTLNDDDDLLDSYGDEHEIRHRILDYIGTSGECLVEQINVDEVVDSLLLHPSEKDNLLLTVPGYQFGISFCNAVEQWSNYVQSTSRPQDDGQDSNDILLPKAASCRGSQCRSCEYRVEAATLRPNQRCGFDECWPETAPSSPKNSPPLIDLWNSTPKQISQYLDEQKFSLTDLSWSDFHLDQHGNPVTSTTTTNSPKRKTKSNDNLIQPLGMTRSQRQWYQVLSSQRMANKNTVNDKVMMILDRPYLQAEMKNWHYPFHFVDFETVAPALPYCLGKAPYDLLAFQFSHHILPANAVLAEHKNQFLHIVPGQCPNELFLENLARALPNNEERGTVFCWGHHENSVFKALLSSLDHEKLDPSFSISIRASLEPLLEGSSHAMVDLMQIAKKGYFVGGIQGSLSLKKLLLPTMQASSRLLEIYGQPTYFSSNFSRMQWWKEEEKQGNEIVNERREWVMRDPYSLLDQDEDIMVSTGQDAIVAFDMLQQSNICQITRSRIEASLLRYCELDTLAMAMIVQAWQGFLEDDWVQQ